MTFMTFLLFSYFLTTSACLRYVYYVFKLRAREGEGDMILLLIALSIIPVINSGFLFIVVSSTVVKILVESLDKQLERRKT